MGENLKLRGTLAGHGGWVTAIATTAEDPNMILSASRDKVRETNEPPKIVKVNESNVQNHSASLCGL